MAKGLETRTRIMDIAQDAVLAKGFDATSIDEIVAAAEITKGGFFYHFPDKTALARALLERYISEEDKIFDDLFDRATALTDDPLQALLVGLKLFAEMLSDLPQGHPGCLIAAAAYQDRLFDAEIQDLNRRAMLAWRIRFRGVFDDIAAIYPLRDAIDLDDLADMLTVSVEGGIIISKVMLDPKALARQVLLVRSYLKLLFSPSLQ